MKRFAVILAMLFAAGVSVVAQCPTITVVGPASVTSPGDNMTFRAEVGIVGPKIEYKWSVSAGIIVEGQGTPAINVVTNITMSGSTATATVEIEGLPSACEKTGTAMAPIEFRIGCGMPSDEWGVLRPNDERARLDAFFSELANDPGNIGFLVLYITHRERLDSNNQRVQLVLKHAKLRKFDVGRIWFGLELWEERRTKLYRLPPGAENRPCTECLIIKGEDLK